MPAVPRSVCLPTASNGPMSIDLQNLPGLTAIVPLRDTEQQISLGSRRFTNCRAIATAPDWFRIINLPIDRGLTFTQVQYDRAAAVAVLGAGAATQMFPYEDPIGRTITLGVGSSGHSSSPSSASSSRPVCVRTLPRATSSIATSTWTSTSR